MNFEANVGQIDPAVHYLAHGPGYAIGLTDRGAVLSLVPHAKPDVQGSASPASVRLEISGSHPSAPPVAEEPLPGRVNYLIGNDPSQWRRDVKTFAKVRYAGVYPGVDLVYYGTRGSLEYDFALAPGANPAPIRLTFAGAEHLKIDEHGDLHLRAAGQEIDFQRPVAYQMVAGRRIPVTAAYRLAGRSIGFRVGHYDHAQPLVIDPVLRYLTYVGGAGYDVVGTYSPQGGLAGLDPGQATAIDANKDIFVTGSTTSTNFPTVAAFAPPATKTTGTTWAFVTKLSADATSLVYSTYLGGTNGNDYGFSVALDAQGDAFVVGESGSSDFPSTPGAFQRICSPNYTNSPNNPFSSCGNNNGYEAFVAKLSPSGALLAASFLGGTHTLAIAEAVAVDAAGRPYVVGTTYPGEITPASISTQTLGFPTTPGALLSPFTYSPGVNANNNQQDAFVSVFAADLSSLVYSTLIGDSQPVSQTQNHGLTYGTAIALDASGHFYVGGWTQDATTATTAGSLQPSLTSCGLAYPGQTVLNGRCGYLAKFTPAGGTNPPTLAYGTFFGHTAPGAVGEDYAITGIAVDPAGDAYIVGYTNQWGVPTTVGAYQTTCNRYNGTTNVDNNCSSAFLAKLDPTGSTLLASTYYGCITCSGDAVYQTAGIALDAFGNVYFGGTGGDSLPNVNGSAAASAAASGGVAPFAVEFDPTLKHLVFSTLLNVGGAGQISTDGLVLDATGAIYVVGGVNSPSASTATTGVFQAAYGGGSSDGFVAKILPHTVTALGEQADLLGTGKADYAVWRASLGEWYVLDAEGNSLIRQWGEPTDVPVLGDFDGDGKTDVGVWRPSLGEWYIINSSNQSVTSQQWGAQGDQVVRGDFDGDGKSDIAVWRPANGTWYVIASSTHDVLSQQWGLPADIPVPGDYDGDGKTDFAVYRPSSGEWYIIYSSTGQVVSRQWGEPGDMPVPGYYDGSGKSNIAVWRPSNGTWYLLGSAGQQMTQQWGESGDVPVPRDYDGDGKVDFAVWRPSTGTWYVMLTGSQAMVSQQWGEPTDLPLSTVP